LKVKKKKKKGGLIPLTKYEILKLDEKEFVFITNITAGSGKGYIYIPKVITTMIGSKKRVKVSLAPLLKTLS